MLHFLYDWLIIDLTGQPEGNHYFPAPAKTQLKIVVDFLRVRTAIFYFSNSELQRSKG